MKSITFKEYCHENDGTVHKKKNKKPHALFISIWTLSTGSANALRSSRFPDFGSSPPCAFSCSRTMASAETLPFTVTSSSENLTQFSFTRKIRHLIRFISTPIINDDPPAVNDSCFHFRIFILREIRKKIGSFHAKTRFRSWKLVAVHKSLSSLRLETL